MTGTELLSQDPDSLSTADKIARGIAFMRSLPADRVTRDHWCQPGPDGNRYCPEGAFAVGFGLRWFVVQGSGVPVRSREFLYARTPGGVWLSQLLTDLRVGHDEGKITMPEAADSISRFLADGLAPW